VVMSASNAVSADPINSPFSSLAQPISYAVSTVWSGKKSRRGAGTPWSRRILTLAGPPLRSHTSVRLSSACWSTASTC